MNNIVTISERIALLVEEYGKGKNTVLANKVGVSEGNIRSYIKGILPKQDVLEKIVRSCENLSAEWLLTGNGPMFKTDTNNSINNVVQSVDKGEGIPLIPFSAMAGALSGEHTALDYECEHYVVPAFQGADFLIPIKGCSMYPTYASGDIVACKRVPMTDIFFQWNKVYVIDTCQGALIKRIKPGKDNEHILIVSDNEEYDPFELAYSEIYAVALVIGVIRLE